MEAEAEADRKETGGNIKRKMKTPTQLETLERTYLNDNYPSEAVRAELSVQLGLSDRQLQMWFCHRRLKDKKPKKEKEQPAPSPPPPSALMANYYGDFDASRNQRGLKPNCEEGVWKKKAQVPALQHLSPAEVRAIAAVEAQLGEPLQEDGPILGVDFDPLPPGAFDSPTAPILEQYKQGGHHYEKLFDGQDARSNKRSSGMLHTEHAPLATTSNKRKAVMVNVPTIHSQPGSRAPQEYQFLPEQPSGRHDAYERATKSRFYETSFEGLSSNAPSLSTTGNLLHGHDQLTGGYSFPNQISNSTMLPQENRSAHMFSRDNVDYEGLQHKDSYPGFGYDGHFGSHQGLGADEAYLHSEKRAFYQDQDQSRIEKKRKSEEARIAKEVEAHERRIRKELEKQEIMRRKMEEKQDREKRKEEERMMREKQREEERLQRENRRLIERREKILQKESKRAEKMRLKDELRREKEAARQKAANERATARKLARESMELIEDERLELMEAAASAKGLSSIFLLDDDILLQLEAYKGILGVFPPKSVKMKIPFAVRPWTDSQQNVGNLLMVWRFIITFADVLGLWPFTLDEFVQALHDYDSRLLGEIHVSLLKTIVKDIEDVACATSNGLGANQNNVGLAGGGHPQLVEAAFAWGFDIREWRQYLNPLTWPEVLRQFALAAGFGPQWKKCRSFHEHLRDDNESQEGEDAVSTLRSGAAAASAVAMMQGRGSGHSRRCRYRLTPGTVKYAAFHVLSLEGGNGLTILEVAEKIQESGLRDLTTSKTPEASIAAALSRDSNLFERVAPSTYCVRPAFRKDPNDAQAVLQAAREKIQSFQSGLSDSEEAEKDTEDVEEGERDEEYECDDVEDADADADADDLDGPVNSAKVIFCLKEGKVVKSLGSIEKEKCQANEPCDRRSMSPEVDRDPKHKSSILLESAKDIEQDNFKDVSSNGDGDIDSHKVNHMLGETEIDESHTGDPWVQGLMEGEYSDLSVEERLNALVALIGVANEGNTVRIVLEERQEAANALKRQMWAEAQLDKKRLKEEQLSRSQVLPFGGIKSEGANNNTLFEGGQNPFVGLDNKGSEASVLHQPKCEGLVDVISVTNHCLALTNSAIPVEKNLLFPDNSPVQETSMAHVGYTSEKSRAQLKASIGLRAEELYVYRSIPLGQDRRHNRYWQFVTCPSGNDPGLGRIFFESHGEGHWKVIDTDEAFDALLASLDTRGVREAHLHVVLQKLESSFKQAVRKRSFLGEEIDLIFGQEVKTEFAERTSYPGCVMEDAGHGGTIDMSRSFSIDLGRNNVENKHALERYMDFEKWLWIECIKPSALNALKLKKKRCLELLRSCEVCHEVYWSRDRHCSFCHCTFESSHKFEVKFPQHVLDCEEKKRRKDPSWRLEGPTWALPSRVQLLKVAIAAVEASIPSEALKTFWTEGYRRSWGLSLKSATSPAELLQIITQLEGAVNRDWLSSTFETTKELLDFISGDTGLEENNLHLSEVPVLPWIPHTTAAVALRLMALDHSLSYSLDQKAEKQAANDFEDTSKILSNVAVKNFQELEACDKGSPSDEERKEDTWTDPANGRNTRGRRGGRPRGRGRGGKNSTPRIESGFNKDSKRKLHFSGGGTFGTNEDQKTVRGQARRGRASKRGRGRGTGSSRQRQLGIQKRDVKEKQPNHFTNSGMGIEKRFSVELGEDDEPSDGSQSIEGEEWGRHDDFGEGENNVDHHYIEEDNVGESSEQDEDIDEACEDAQATEDEFEDVDMKYENKYFARDVEAEDSEAGEAVDVDTESGDEDEEDDEDGSMSESSKNSD
ncbi:hypothetical protein SUGI_1173340 [Cryptomeria japonica]|uniref:homeobox-DDT domain protein RLT2 isoform X2 n=1 Tax=Cryptomeria japonica TaxID=3369 RepID=UPI002414909A|nr:homeobox-DDT domain protein RLT2 isoform X2 [Cryptomeria japonica]GLJ54616.1 hypothetical protein SUGI_1173340 [Cryptomeria japonica]